eukprot:gb/GEZN01012148.1/.p1 GENE.gb/GEZN01012148.1/~~gb/GEZN01012148.1/.p1  ORF type:complete len:265 (-),score=45.57 gb/GEZN01012148.1/:310-1080(-)
MGNICGSNSMPAEPRVPSHLGGHSAGGTLLADCASLNDWDTEIPMTKKELHGKRNMFWETRVEGRQEAWQTIRMAAECGDPTTAKTILSSAGLTDYQIDKNLRRSVSDTCYCFDELGNRYEVPLYVLYSPKTLVDEPEKVSRPEDVSPFKSTEEGSQKKVVDAKTGQGTPGTVAPPKEEIKVKVRLSSSKDLTVSLPFDAKVVQLKTAVQQQEEIPVSRLRIFVHGHQLSDSESLSKFLRKGLIVQVFILPPPEQR